MNVISTPSSPACRDEVPMNIPPSLLGNAPYPGLRPFRSDETGIFFGREAQVDALLEKLDHFRFLAVTHLAVGNPPWYAPG